MILTIELTLILLGLLGFAGWAVFSGIRQSQNQQSRRRINVTPQELSALAQPYRKYMGEAAEILEDVVTEAKTAPPVLERELNDLAQRMGFLVKRALPRAQHGTRLASFLLKLEPSDDQYQQTQAAAEQTRADLESFLTDLKALRGKVYQILTDATRLQGDPMLEEDLQNVMIEVSALEEAFKDVETV